MGAIRDLIKKLFRRTDQDTALHPCSCGSDLPEWECELLTDHQDNHWCQWFALCVSPATAHRDHPIMGKVPVCSEHATFGE